MILKIPHPSWGKIFCKSGEFLLAKNSPVIKKFGDFLAATAIHIGAYTDLLPVYFSLAEWIDKHGFETNGPPVEQYLVGPIDLASEENYVTKIIWPVKRKS